MKLVEYRTGSPFNWDTIFNGYLTDEEHETVSPGANAYEKKDNLHIDLEIPGVKKDKINITLENTVLNVKAERELPDVEAKDSYLREFGGRKYERSFRISDQYAADKVEANYTNGILKLVLKKNPKAPPKHITIN